jgi:hypothetical protein
VELTVQHPPGSEIPNAGQLPDNLSHCSPSVLTEQSGNILPDKQAGPRFLHHSGELKEQTAARSSEAATPASHGKVLTGEASGDNVNASQVATVELRNVVIARHLRPVMFQHTAGMLVNLALRDGLDPRQLEAEVEAPHAAEQARVCHRPASSAAR